MVCTPGTDDILCQSKPSFALHIDEVIRSQLAIQGYDELELLGRACRRSLCFCCGFVYSCNLLQRPSHKWVSDKRMMSSKLAKMQRVVVYTNEYLQSSCYVGDFIFSSCQVHAMGGDHHGDLYGHAQTPQRLR